MTLKNYNLQKFINEQSNMQSRRNILFLKLKIGIAIATVVFYELKNNNICLTNYISSSYYHD